MKQINYGETFKEEIKDLEAKLEAKKKEALEMGQDASEKEVFSQTLKEHIDQESQSSSENLNAGAQTPATQTPHAIGDDGISTEESKHFLESLVAHALDKGILSAVKEARKTKNAYLIDKLHDELADHFYQKLLDSRQIRQD